MGLSALLPSALPRSPSTKHKPVRGHYSNSNRTLIEQSADQWWWAFQRAFPSCARLPLHVTGAQRSGDGRWDDGSASPSAPFRKAGARTNHVSVVLLRVLDLVVHLLSAGRKWPEENSVRRSLPAGPREALLAEQGLARTRSGVEASDGGQRWRRRGGPAMAASGRIGQDRAGSCGLVRDRPGSDGIVRDRAASSQIGRDRTRSCGIVRNRTDRTGSGRKHLPLRGRAA